MAKRLVLINAGKSFTRPLAEGEVVSRTVNNKAARRMLRAQAIRTKSTAAKRIAQAQKNRADAREATDNSHAAKRLLEAERGSKAS